MEFINRMRKDKKGFTLVEIIVVLVILAILAAFTIPSMLGFVGDAKGKAMIAEAREVYVAAQSSATEMNATQGLTDVELSSALGSVKVAAATATDPAAVSGDAADVTAKKAAANKASYQMKKYLDNTLEGDLSIYATALPAKVLANTVTAGSSAWTVTVGDGTASTGKVTTVVYYKNGYQITISGGNAAVVKLPTT